MKVVRVRTVWEAEADVEVPDDYVWDGRSLDSEWADQVDSGGAMLVDYEVIDD